MLRRKEKPIEMRAEGWDMSEKEFQDVDEFLHSMRYYNAVIY